MSTVNMGGTKVYTGHQNQFNDALDMKNALPAQREAIKNDPNLTPEQKNAQLKGLDEVEKQLDMALDFTTLGGKFDTNSGSIAGDKDMGAILQCLSDAKAGLEKMETAVGTAAASAQTPADPPKHSCGTSGTGGTTGAGGTGGTSGTGGTGGANNDPDITPQQQAYNANFAGKKPEDLANMASADPQKFYENLKNLSPEDRQSTMMMMNQHLQDMNQMFSMMSNLSKAMHDTAKALIGNMRV